jgi:hypothetical protein
MNRRRQMASHPDEEPLFSCRKKTPMFAPVFRHEMAS